MTWRSHSVSTLSTERQTARNYLVATFAGGSVRLKARCAVVGAARFPARRFMTKSSGEVAKLSSMLRVISGMMTRLGEQCSAGDMYGDSAAAREHFGEREQQTMTNGMFGYTGK